MWSPGLETNKQNIMLTHKPSSNFKSIEMHWHFRCNNQIYIHRHPDTLVWKAIKLMSVGFIARQENCGVFFYVFYISHNNKLLGAFYHIHCWKGRGRPLVCPLRKASWVGDGFIWRWWSKPRGNLIFSHCWGGEIVTGSTKILEEKNPEPKVVSALQAGIKHLQICIACTWASRKD